MTLGKLYVTLAKLYVSNGHLVYFVSVLFLEFNLHFLFLGLFLKGGRCLFQDVVLQGGCFCWQSTRNCWRFHLEPQKQNCGEWLEQLCSSARKLSQIKCHLYENSHSIFILPSLFLRFYHPLLLFLSLSYSLSYSDPLFLISLMFPSFQFGFRLKTEWHHQHDW